MWKALTDTDSNAFKMIKIWPNTETESHRHTDTEIESETERSKVEKITKLFSDSKKVYQRLTFQKQRGNKLQLFN